MPDVEPEMVVIVAIGEEGRLIAEAGRPFHAEDLDVEAFGTVEVAHLQMDVSDPRFRRSHETSLPQDACRVSRMSRTVSRRTATSNGLLTYALAPSASIRCLVDESLCADRHI